MQKKYYKFVFCTKVILLFTAINNVLAADFNINKMQVYSEKDVYYLNADFKIPHKKNPISALRHGATLEILISIRTYQKIAFFRDETVALLQQKYHLQYHNLPKIFSLNNKNTNKITTYNKLSYVFKDIGQLRSLPLIDKTLLDKNKEYYIAMQVLASVIDVPPAVRSYHFFSDNLQITSNTKTWELE
jgi:hypothetical protein